jgi:hypothetical protein
VNRRALSTLPIDAYNDVVPKKTQFGITFAGQVGNSWEGTIKRQTQQSDLVFFKQGPNSQNILGKILIFFVTLGLKISQGF